MNKLIKADTLPQLMQHSKSWWSNRTGTSADDWKARLKDWTWLPVRNLLLCHWSSQLFDWRAPSSTDIPILLLSQPIVSYQCKSVKSLKTKRQLHDREDLSLLRNCFLRRKNILLPTMEFRFPKAKHFAYLLTRKVWQNHP